MNDRETYDEVLQNEPPNQASDLAHDGKLKTATTKKMKSDGSLEFYDWLQCVVSAVLIGILLFVFIGRTIGVDGSSMLPTLHHTDRVVTSNLFYTPKYGDIVIVKTDAFGDTPIVKRVIAVAGQTVDINFVTGDVMVDGNVLNEPYINALTVDRLDFIEAVTVPEGCVFVMGDNRNKSTDSRSNSVGMVDTRRILGKVLMIMLPGIEQDTKVRTWSRFGSVY